MEQELYRKALTIRLFEEKLLSLFSEGKLSGTVHTCIGQELCALAVVDGLAKGDWIFSNHRCHGHYLARFNEPQGLLAEIRGLPTGICGGRGGSQHVYRDRFLSNGVQGGGVPIAAGCAMAMEKRPDPAGAIAVAFIGDGTLGQGVVYETLNLASRWGLPLLVVLEQNGYAQSTNTTETIAGSVRARFEAFGFKYWEGSIWDESKLFADAASAVAYVRGQRVPAVISIACYRLKAHSKGDDNREKGEVALYEERDPIRVFEREQPSVASDIRTVCQAAIDAAARHLDADVASVAGGNAGPAAGHIGTGPVAEAGTEARGWTRVRPHGQTQRVVERLRAGLRTILGKDEAVIVLGEDVEDPYGGAFKVTKGLSSSYPGRVRNTPISEAAIVGVGNGLALAGLRPVVEIMFGDFITLAADQIVNQATKFAYIYNEQVRVPIMIRTPMGGHRGYGATHSQSLERIFFGTPGLDVVAVNPVLDPAILLERVHEHCQGPCLVVENKGLYTVPVRNVAADGRIWLENGATFPTLKLDGGETASVTVVAYGGSVDDVEAAVKKAFFEHEVVCEVLVPARIFPLDVDPIAASVAKTGRLLVVEEGQGFAGFGAEVLAACSERLSGRAFVSKRVCAAPHAIPCARDLEKSALPGVADILRGILATTEA